MMPMLAPEARFDTYEEAKRHADAHNNALEAEKRKRTEESSFWARWSREFQKRFHALVDESLRKVRRSMLDAAMARGDKSVMPARVRIILELADGTSYEATAENDPS